MRNLQAFYASLCRPLVKRLGAPVDPETITAVVGFDAGGPISLCTIGLARGGPVNFVSCELATRRDQVHSASPPFELMLTARGLYWPRRLLTIVGGLSLEFGFGNHHSLDVGAIVGANCQVQGVVFERFSASTIGARRYAVLSCIGVTRRELAFAAGHGVPALLRCLKRAGVYPVTGGRRRSVLLAA